MDRNDAIIVSTKSYDSTDHYDIIGSNISFINALFQERFRVDEISVYALQSYYVDYYLAQMNNGGFSQFVYNSGWNQNTLRFIFEGLKSMGTQKHLAMLEKAGSSLDQMEPKKLAQFFDGVYFGENEERDFFNQYSDAFYELDKVESLIELNSKWLKQHPSLIVMSIDEMKAEIDSRVLALPDMDERIAEALAREPRYKKIIRKLCRENGHHFDRITTGSYLSNFGESTPIIGWNFITDKGQFYMVEVDEQAFMYEADSNILIGQTDDLLTL